VLLQFQLGQPLRLPACFFAIAVAQEVLGNGVSHAGAAALAELPGQLIELPLEFRIHPHPDRHDPQLFNETYYSLGGMAAAGASRCSIDPQLLALLINQGVTRLWPGGAARHGKN